MRAVEEPSVGQQVQRRVEWLALAIGLTATVFAGVRWGASCATGFATGAGLSWLNYRWLKQGVLTIVPSQASAHAHVNAGEAIPESEHAGPKVPLKAFAKFFGRYVLVIAALYVILAYSLLPAAAFLAGLFVVVAAVLAELLYELMGRRL
ncbi:MAG TPA: hypothetical protein VOA41_12745 [Candidatus Dormibacteraeota bacterium]|nr:hypothetical protein [Candidatus Dormibacteraeota bacterium]